MVISDNNLLNIFTFISAARFGRPQAAATSNDSHSNTQWLPNAEEYRKSSIYISLNNYFFFI
jgi:hypothetical protein